MTQPGAFTPYSGIVPWLTTPPSWVPPASQTRIQSYQLYDELYWSHISTTYKVMNRGLDEDDQPIYVPASRVIVETVNRYVGPGMRFSVVPESGSPGTRGLAEVNFTNLFARERVRSRYNANKRYGLIRGDWLWHLMADPAKPEGSRIRLVPIDPASYFPVFEDELYEGGDPDRVVRVHLAERIQQGDKFIVRRQTYDKLPDGSITSIMTEHEEDKWFGEEETGGRVVRPLVTLPKEITSIPVYHIPNFDTPGDPFGSSELRGLETVVAALNQSTTDEDLALALMGLGVYATDELGSPIDPVSRQQREWLMYPGAVIENAKGLRRVEGITSVTPYNDHLDRLERWLGKATGATAQAQGNIEVQTAESGIARLLNLAPMMAKAAEKDDVIRDVHAQLFYDLRAWFLVYERQNFMDVTIVPTFGDKLPVDRKGEVELVATLMATVPPILSAQSARVYLKAKGFEGIFAEDEEERVMVEMEQVAAAQQGLDAVGGRMAEELEGSSEAATADSGAGTALAAPGSGAGA